MHWWFGFCEERVLSCLRTILWTLVLLRERCWAAWQTDIWGKSLNNLLVVSSGSQQIPYSLVPHTTIWHCYCGVLSFYRFPYKIFSLPYLDFLILPSIKYIWLCLVDQNSHCKPYWLGNEWTKTIFNGQKVQKN